jgi:hypothetical protein
MKQIETIDSRYNDYTGRFKGRLVSPRQWAELDMSIVDEHDYVLVENVNYLKEFCQLDTMIHNTEFLHYIRNLVQSDELGNGKDTNEMLKEIWLKVRSITLHDNFIRTDKINKENFSIASGDFLTKWELNLISTFLRDYREYFLYLNDENYSESRYWEEQEFKDEDYEDYLMELDAYYEEQEFYSNNDLDDELPF